MSESTSLRAALRAPISILPPLSASWTFVSNALTAVVIVASEGDGVGYWLLRPASRVRMFFTNAINPVSILRAKPRETRGKNPFIALFIGGHFFYFVLLKLRLIT